MIKQCYKSIDLSITEHVDHLRPGNSRWEVSNCFFPHIANDIDYYLSSKLHQKHCEITEAREGFNKALHHGGF